MFLCGLAQSLPALALARLVSGAAAGWIVPLSIAYVGDVTPYESRQQMLARYVSGNILGQLFGQAAGGVLGDWFGWRRVFFLLAVMLALATAALVWQLVSNPLTRMPLDPQQKSRGLVADYRLVLRNPWARIVILAVGVEGALLWGSFAYVGADLHQRFGLSLTAIGAIVAHVRPRRAISSFFGDAPRAQFRPDRAAAHRRHRARGRLPGARLRAVLVAGASRRGGGRARLLHAAQHAADHRHPDDAGSARHRGRDLLLGVLSRARPRASR